MAEHEFLRPPIPKRHKTKHHQDFTEDVEVEAPHKEESHVTSQRQVEHSDKYTDYVSQEELDQLRHFTVLDEVSENPDSDDNDKKANSSDEFDDEEIESMLEEQLPEEMKDKPTPKPKPYVTSQATVLEEKGVNQFEVLPLDWVAIRHQSGMPFYLHRPTRVCTFGKPYFVGKAHPRSHNIPISAIPCLLYKRALEEEKKQEEIDRKITEQIRTGSWKKYVDQNTDIQETNINNENEQNITNDKGICPHKENSNSDENVDEKATIEKGDEENPAIRPVILPGGQVMLPPRVESVADNWKCQQLMPEQLTEYCKALFKFKTINVMRFDRWTVRRKYAKARKALQCPSMPKGTKLISIPVADEKNRRRRDWVMNGRSYLSVFHEYVRRAMSDQPQYVFTQLENPSCPYQATVVIGGMQYGVGRGSSKQRAKADAAKQSIRILIPEMKHDLDEVKDQDDDQLAFFDSVGISDPRIASLSSSTGEPAPFALLRICLSRNCGTTDKHIHTDMKKLDNQKIELTMRVGQHSASVVCKNKKTAKQKAAQAILQSLHPQVKSWGSLLRLYGTKSIKSCKEKKLEEQQITLLQDKAQRNEPNYAVLEKLREEMRRLRERDEAMVPLGTMMVSHSLPEASSAGLSDVKL